MTTVYQLRRQRQSALTTSPITTTDITQETRHQALTIPDVHGITQSNASAFTTLEMNDNGITKEQHITLTTSPMLRHRINQGNDISLTTPPDVTTTGQRHQLNTFDATTVSTQETTTSTLTTSPDATTTVSTKETTTSALTTSPDVTTTVSTKEATTSTLTTSPDVTTTVSNKETTTSALTTSPDVTTPVSTQETTTSPLTTSKDVTTTHNIETKTSVQLTTSSPLKITISTKVVTVYCPEEILNNITWSHIAAGQKETQKCPPGYTGNAFRKCNDNGDWVDPVYIECVNMVLHETSETVNTLRNITDPVKVAEGITGVLDIIDTTIGKENPPTSGDLKHTTTILTDIIDIGTAANASVDSEKFGDVLNSVLDTDNSGSWNEVNSEDQSDEGASKIMGIVDSLGSLVQKNLLPNETVIINKTNLVIEVSTLKKKLTFPPDSNSISKLVLANQPSLQDTLYTAALYRTLSGILPRTPNRYVKNEWTVILSNMCVVLIIGYSVFLSSTTVTDNDIACIIVTAVLHYVFLVVFFLMLCEGISVARSVTVVFKRKSEVRFYLPFAWGVPLVIVGITLGVTRLKGYHSEKYCWLSTNNFVLMAFVGPALLIILINIGIIHVVLKAIYSTNAMVNERLKKKVRAGVKCMVVLIPVLGLSWLFGILAYNEDTIIFQYLFGISTSLQGFIIFIRDAVSNKKLHEGIRRAVHRYRSNSMLKASSKTQ
ncbi:Hypothetical predicted protein, partial [Mytilus galloprovincialis]